MNDPSKNSENDRRPDARRGFLGRGLLWLIAVAGVGVVAVAGVGFRWFGDQRLHVLLALVASLLLLFAHSWILIYLAGTGRLIRRATREETGRGLDPLDPGADAGADSGSDVARRRLVRRAIPALAAAALAVVALFLSGVAMMIGIAALGAHRALFVGVLALQVVAIVAAGPALAETERRIRAIDREPSPPGPLSQPHAHHPGEGEPS